MANVIDYILKVRDEVSPSLQKIEKGLFNLSLFSQANVSLKAFDFFKEAVEEATLFEKQMVEVTKVLDEGFVSNIDNIRWLKSELRGVGREVPKTIDEIMAIAAEGAKMGIAGPDIPEFTKGVAQVSRAFEIASEEAANKFIKVLSALGRDVTYKDINYLGGEMNEIANNMKVKGRELLYAMNLSTSSLKNAGLNEKQIIALNSAGLQVGLQPGVTGHALIKYATMMSKVQETRKGRWALYYLGFSEKEWNVMRRNPELRNEEILKRLAVLREKSNRGDIQAETRYQMALDAMLGHYRGKDIDKIVAQISEYYRALELVSNEANVLGSLEKELSQVTDTLNDRILLLKNSFREFIGEIGDMFVPSLKKITDVAASILQNATDGIKELKNDDTSTLKKIDNYIDVAKSLGVAAGTYLAWGLGVSALGLTAPISGPILAGIGMIGAAGAGIASYGSFREGKQEKEKPDNFNLNETTNQISQVKQEQIPISLKVEGELKAPTGYAVEGLHFEPAILNHNFGLGGY